MRSERLQMNDKKQQLRDALRERMDSGGQSEQSGQDASDQAEWEHHASTMVANRDAADSQWASDTEVSVKGAWEEDLKRRRRAAAAKSPVAMGAIGGAGVGIMAPLFLGGKAQVLDLQYVFQSCLLAAIGGAFLGKTFIQDKPVRMPTEMPGPALIMVAGDLDLPLLLVPRARLSAWKAAWAHYTSLYHEDLDQAPEGDTLRGILTTAKVATKLLS